MDRLRRIATRVAHLASADDFLTTHGLDEDQDTIYDLLNLGGGEFEKYIQECIKDLNSDLNLDPAYDAETEFGGTRMTDKDSGVIFISIIPKTGSKVKPARREAKFTADMTIGDLRELVQGHFDYGDIK